MTSIHELTNGIPESEPVTADDVQQHRHDCGDSTFFVVLDDDPTGTQSISDLPVLTSWAEEDFSWAFSTGRDAVYVMTNSRSLDPESAKKINTDVVQAAYQAAIKSGKELAFVSRSDSTLRGHFPLEPETLANEIEAATGTTVDGIVLVPAFGDAGRITVDSVHYAGSANDGFVPVSETEFANDATFGFSTAYLPEWVEEKSEGHINADSVIRINLTTLRTDPEGTVELLRQAQNRQVICVDIVTEEDLRSLALALISAEASGSQFVYRVGPPFVRARIGQEIREPLRGTEVYEQAHDPGDDRGGLIVIGSHVDLTTRQLDALREEENPDEFEIDVEELLNRDSDSDYISDIAQKVSHALREGNVILRTSRTLIKTDDPEESLAISRKVSAAVVHAVQEILATYRPKFVIAKGGITSSDVATHGLGIGRAMVAGPMLPGIVSAWVAEDGPAVGIPYIVFAGNVGTETSLAEVVKKLSEK